MTEDIEKPEPIFHARERYYHADEMDAYLAQIEEKAKKCDELEVIRKAFALTVLEMNNKLEAVRGWVKLYDWRKFDLMTDEQSERAWGKLKEILGEKE